MVFVKRKYIIHIFCIDGFFRIHGFPLFLVLLVPFSTSQKVLISLGLSEVGRYRPSLQCLKICLSVRFPNVFVPFAPSAVYRFFFSSFVHPFFHICFSSERFHPFLNTHFLQFFPLSPSLGFVFNIVLFHPFPSVSLSFVCPPPFPLEHGFVLFRALRDTVLEALSVLSSGTFSQLCNTIERERLKVPQSCLTANAYQVIFESWLFLVKQEARMCQQPPFCPLG